MLAALHQATTSLDVALATWHAVAEESAIPDEDDIEVTLASPAHTSAGEPSDPTEAPRSAVVVRPVPVHGQAPSHGHGHGHPRPAGARPTDLTDARGLRCAARARRAR